MRNNLQPKCRMPWERAGVTLQGPGLSNCASLFNRLFCISTQFIHYCAFLPPSTVGTEQPLLQHSTVVQGVLASPPCNQGPLPPTAATATAHLRKTRHFVALQLYPIIGNGLLQLHCDLCTVPVSQLVENAPPQSLCSQHQASGSTLTVSMNVDVDCFNICPKIEFRQVFRIIGHRLAC